jgi:hypothetical protein
MYRSWKVEDIYGSEYLGIKDDQMVPWETQALVYCSNWDLLQKWKVLSM